MNPTPTRKEMCLDGLRMKLFASFAMSIFAMASYGQVSSTNGNFTATTPSNLSLQAGATPTTRLTILNSNGNVGINTTSPADWLHVNGNARANQFNTTTGVLNTIGATTNMSFNINGTNRMTLLSGGNLGIGTATPADLLHVNGITRATQFSATNGNFNTVGATNLSLGTNGTAQMTLLNANGNFGIGTTTPTEKLEVAGNIAFGSIYGLKTYASGLKIGSFTGGQGFDLQMVANNGVTYNKFSPIANVIGGSAPTNASALFEIQSTTQGFLPPRMTAAQRTAIATPATGLTVYQTDGPAGTYQFDGTTWGQLATGTGSQWTAATGGINYSSGNVGIGTTTPSQKLEVNGFLKVGAGDQFLVRPASGAIGYSEAFLQGQSLGISLFANPQATGYTLTGGVAVNAGEVGIVSNGYTSTPFVLVSQGDFRFRNGGTENVRFTSAGNVGIGTTTPAYKLDVAGTINATSILVNGQPLSSSSSQWATNGSNISYAAGNVGIGTTTPAGKLDVFGNSPSSTNLVLSANYAIQYRWRMKTFDRGNAVDLDFTASDAGDTEETVLQLSRSTSSRPEFRVMTDWLVANNGNVGIGTTTPAYKLDVAGTINATSILVNGQPISGGSSQWATNGSNISYATGNVGIGTTDPQTLLNVNVGRGGVDGIGGFRVGGFNNYSSLELGIEGDYDAMLRTYGNDIKYYAGHWKTKGISATENHRHIWFTSKAGSANWSTEKMVLNEDGNLGIGTSTPSAKLNVYNSGPTQVIVGNSSTGTGGFTSLLFGTSADSNGYGYLQSIKSSGTALGDIILNKDGGNVGIGTTAPDAKLAVKGTIHTNEVKVDLNGAVAPDYVFEKDYALMSLEETKAYIDANKHLPEVPSAKEMEKNGVQLGEMNLLLLKKVEELTLNLIQINERLKQVESENKELKKGLENKK